MPDLSWINLCSALVFVLTIWIMRRRFTEQPDWNRALYYYAGLVLYARGFEGVLQNNFVFIGIICALFIRFEFLGKQLLSAFRFLEFLVHCYIVFVTFRVLFSR